VVEPGRRCLGDRYELHRLIAAGGMGQVWRGYDLALHRPVAVKVLRSEYTGDPTFVARFRAEAQHAASLSHPNIAAVFDYGEEIAQDGTGETLAYLVMELVEGEPLSALVAREGPLGPEATLSLLRQTAFGLGEAHDAGMVHRDVKPGNILVRPDGSVIGTPQYLSPEQAEGRPATPASDVYALGLIGYECLAGRPAFEGDNPVTIALKQVRQEPDPLPGDLPAEVRGLIGRALAKDAGRRFSDGAAFVAAIDDVRAGRPLPQAPTTVAVPSAGVVAAPRYTGPNTLLTGSVARPPVARRRSRIAMVALPLLGLLTGAGISVALIQALSDDPTGSPTEAAQQQDSGSIVLDAGQYIGRTVDEVAGRLTRLGLNVELRSEVRDDVVADQVTGVEPDGKPLAAGDTVVVTYATDDPAGGVAPNGPAVTHAVDGGTAVDEVAGTTTVDGPAPSAIATSTSTSVTTLPATPTATDSAPETSDSGTAAPTTTRTTTSTTTTATSSSDG
jgi:hypothetical protein